MSVACITGNGLKTMDAVAAQLPEVAVIDPNLKAFDALVTPSAAPTRPATPVPAAMRS